MPGRREPKRSVDLLVADPQDAYAVDAVRLATGRDVRVGRPAFGDRRPDRALATARAAARWARSSRTSEGEGAGDVDDVEHLRDLASEAPVIRLVNLIIQRAVEPRASDIHIEPFENRLNVRYRIDGVLQEVESRRRPT